MSIKIYSYKNCSTCQKALKYLASKTKYKEPEIIDITTQPPTLAELKAMVKVYDGQVKKLFNTSGQVYREEKISERLPNMSDDEALGLLAKNGRLVKRPFLIVEGKAAAVGFKEDEWVLKLF